MQDVIQRPEIAYLVVLAGAISLPTMALRRRGALAVASLAMGIAAVPAGPHPVTAGFLLAGLLGAIAAGLRGGWQGVLIVLGAALAGWVSRHFFAAVGAGPTLLGTVAIGIIVAALLWLRRFVPSVSVSGTRAVRPMPAGFLVLFLSLAALGSHLSLVFLGVAGASWVVWLVARSPEHARWPVVPALVTLLLFGTYSFMATVAGPEGLSMGGLAGLPFSPAAEVLLAAALLVASWLSSGLWPLHRLSPAPLIAAAAAFLLVRVGLVASPAGMEHWRALAAPLAMLGIWHAATARWAPGLMVGGAWFALINSDGSSGISAAAWLISSAVALELLGPQTDGAPRLIRWGRGLAMLGGGWGGLLAVEAGLHGEVVYTVLAAAGAALGIAAGRQAMTPSAPRSTSPSA